MSEQSKSHSAGSLKASDLFVKALENEGVEYIFAVPGEENLDLLDSLRTSKIKLVLTRHEQGAAFMAATYGRLTGKAGVCMATPPEMLCFWKQSNIVSCKACTRKSSC